MWRLHPKIGNTYYSFCLLKTRVRQELMREVIMACILHVGALRANGLLARNRTGGIRKTNLHSSSAICLRDGSGWARTPNVWAFKMGSQCVGRTGRRRQHFLLCKHGRGCGTTRSHQPNSLLSQRQMVLLKGQPRNNGLSKWLSFLGSVKALNPNLFSRVLACTCRLWGWVQICADFILGATAGKNEMQPPAGLEDGINILLGGLRQVYDTWKSWFFIFDQKNKKLK